MISAFIRLHDWFFAPFSARIAAIYRIGTGIVLFLSFLLVAPYLNAFFTNQGYLSADFIANVATHDRLSLFFWYDQPWFIYALYIVMMAAIVAYTFGILSRLMAFLVWVLALSFYNRFPYISFDGNSLLIMMFMFTIFLETDAALVPKWYPKWKAKFAKLSFKLPDFFRLPAATKPGTIPGWPARIIQMNLALVYLFAAFSKVRADAWFTTGQEGGNVMFFEYATINITWLHHFPLILGLMTWGGLLFELMFPFWIWHRTTRRIALLGLVVIHGTSLIAFNVTYFAETMLAIALIFLREEDLTDLRNLYTQIKNRLSKRHA